MCLPLRGGEIFSLFFIDEVAKYRQYDEEGNALLGEYGQIFEEEYASVLENFLEDNGSSLNPEYASYLRGLDVHETHKGYFSIDKKSSRMVDSSLKRGMDFSDDISAYDLILKDKERLLSFEEPTRFIFSHSALREGWDNPNVFQICTLKHSESNVNKRQEVGRGLRLCVNKEGSRMDSEALGDRVQEINVLTVIASESYKKFAESLQDETKKALYNRPTKADIEYFTGKTVRNGSARVKINENQARKIYRYLVKNDYVDENDGVTKEYRDDAEAQTLASLPEDLSPMGEGIHDLIQAIYDDSVLEKMIEDGNKPKVRENPLNDNFYKKEFQELWNEINHRYAYRVEFDSKELIKKAIAHINEELEVSRLQYTVASASQKDILNADMIKEGSSFESEKTRTDLLRSEGRSQIKYDLIGKIAKGTVLTRKTAAAILKGIRPEKFNMYKENPEEFISRTIRLINEQKAAMTVEHIEYNEAENRYEPSIFTEENHSAFSDKAYPAKKAIQDYVFTDGTAEKSVERKFAQALDGAKEVNVYAKLPKGFYIPTPMGHYSPDWAIVFYEGNIKHIYFIAETKGTMESLSLRPVEKAKIDCAKKLFDSLSHGKVTFAHVDSFEELMNKVMK